MTTKNLMMTAPAAAGGLPFTDDWTGTNGDPWNSAKWGDIVTLSTSVADIQSNAGRMVVQGAIYTSAHARADIPDVADVDILVRATRTTGEIYAQIYARSAGAFTTTAGPTDGYVAWYDGNSNNRRFYLRKLAANVQTDMVNAAFTWENSTVWIRFQVTGTTIRMRAWIDGDGEPGTWLLSTTDPDVAAAGEVWIQCVNGGGTTARTLTWDDITIDEV